MSLDGELSHNNDSVLASILLSMRVPPVGVAVNPYFVKLMLINWSCRPSVVVV